MKYWLMKSEPDVFSIDHLKEKRVSPWDGVRNYQARNFMRDEMKLGDKVLFYHSNATPPGVAGLAEIHRKAYPDFTAWDKKSTYFDPRSTKEKPLWMMVDVKFIEKFPRFVSLDELKGTPQLDGIMVTRKGSRLSIQPVSEYHFNFIVQMGRR